MKRHGLIWNLLCLACGVLAAAVVVAATLPLVPLLSASPRVEREIVINAPISKVRGACTAIIRVAVAVSDTSARLDTLVGMALIPCPDGSGQTIRNLLQSTDAESHHD